MSYASYAYLSCTGCILLFEPVKMVEFIHCFLSKKS